VDNFRKFGTMFARGARMAEPAKMSVDKYFFGHVFNLRQKSRIWQHVGKVWITLFGGLNQKSYNPGIAALCIK
jgi:hypothetical protein